MREFLLLFGICLLVACSKNAEEPLTPKKKDVLAPTASKVVIDDLGNMGDASDFHLTFVRAFDESQVEKYRIFLVPMGQEFGLDMANSVKAESSFRIRPMGINIDTVMPATLKDINGDLIILSKFYQAYVLTVADGKIANTNSLSLPSDPKELVTTTLTITYIGNDGVLIEGYEKKVLIDALPGNLLGWNQISINTSDQLNQAIEPFHNVDLLCITHNHEDHFSPSNVSSFGLASPFTRILGPIQVLNGIILPNEFLLPINRFEKVDTLVNSIPISIIHFRHFDMFGNDFSLVDNFGYLMDIGDFRIFHVGDFDYSDENLDPFDFDELEIDIVLIPAFNTLISETNKNLILQKIAPKHIIALHLQASTPVSTVTAVYGNITVFKSSGDFVSF